MKTESMSANWLRLRAWMVTSDEAEQARLVALGPDVAAGGDSSRARARRGGKSSTRRAARREDERYYRHLDRVDALLYSATPEAAEAEENEEHVKNFGETQ